MPTTEQVATIRRLASTLSHASNTILSGREGVGIGNVRWAGEQIAAAGLDEVCMDAVVMINAAIKAYGQGNDRSASGHAATAGERLKALASAHA